MENRKILFRAKTKDTNKWVFGFITDTHYFLSVNDEKIEKVIIRPETIGQLIRIDDNQMIFEKDIVYYENSFKKEHVHLFYDDWHYGFRQSYSLTSAGSSVIQKGKMKVIGNIIDNPEIFQEPKYESYTKDITPISESDQKRADRYFLGRFK